MELIAKRPLKVWVAALGLASVMAWPQAGLAQDAGARINSMTFFAQTLQDKPPIGVRLYDDSDDNIRLKKAFEDQLVKNGYTVDDASSLALSFEIRNSVTASATNDPGRLSVQGQNAGYAGGEEYRATLELYTSDSPRRGVAITDGSLRLDVALTDRTNGRRIWQGWATAPSAGRDPMDLSARLIPMLIESLGKTVRNEEIKGVE